MKLLDKLDRMMREKKKAQFYLMPYARSHFYDRFTGKSKTFKKNRRRGL